MPHLGSQKLRLISAAVRINSSAAGHGAAVVVNVVAALSGRRQRVRVSDSERDLDRLGVDERGTVPLGSGMRQTLEVAGEKELSWETLHVAPCGHAVGVACFQLVVGSASTCAPAVTASTLLYM